MCNDICNSLERAFTPAYPPYPSCHGHTNRGLGQSTNDGAKSVELKKLGTTQEHENRDEERDKME